MPSLRAVASPFVRFFSGLWHVPAGLLYLIKTPRLWPTAAGPLLIAGVLLVVGVFTGAFWAKGVVSALFGGSLRQFPLFFAYMVVVGIWAGSLSAGAIVAVALAFVFIGPLFERLSRAVERLDGRQVNDSKGMGWELVQSLKTAGYFLLGAPVAVLLGLIPIAGPLLVIFWTGHRLAFQNTDAILLRRGMGFRARQSFHLRHRAETLGFGVGAFFLLPILNIIAVPTLVVGATRLVLDLEEEDDDRSAREPSSALGSGEPGAVMT